MEAVKAEAKVDPAAKPKPEVKKKHKSESEDSSDDSSAASSSDSDSSSSSSEEKPKKVSAPVTKRSEPTNLDLLLSLEDSLPTNASPQTVLTPTMGGMLTPMATQPLPGADSPITDAAAMFIPTKSVELLNKMTTGGLQVLYRFTRSPHLYSPAMCDIQVCPLFLDMQVRTL
jgi:AP-3 complex subunit beta